MEVTSKIYVAGHGGLVGSAICRALRQEGYDNVVTRMRSELDLRDQTAVNSFFSDERPEYVFLAAARVGGIVANASYPADFIMDNLLIEINVINASFVHGVKKLLFLGSNCSYPKNCPQPVKEDYLLTGPLEPTNEPFAVAKIAGITACQALNKQYRTDFVCVMPSNLYGPNDSFDLQDAHVLPALLRRIHEAKMSNSETVTVWGTGNVRRAFLHVDDAATAMMLIMKSRSFFDIVNIGTDTDISIRDLAETIKSVVGFAGELVFDTSKPDGAPQKLLDTNKISQYGWTQKTTLLEGIRDTYKWYLTETEKNQNAEHSLDAK